ncbi:NAD(P)-dependent alcohol dehydrogenase [Halocola ammonii]
MKAITKHRYGGPEVLQLEEVEKPKPGKGEILVRVKANSANPADWHTMRGKPNFARLSFGLFKPKNKLFGSDFAGVVEDAGESSQFSKGDQVYGESLDGGAFAEYISAPENICAKMPENSSFIEMACVPIAGLTALQGLITHGKLNEGESVLINGASGGVGHFAVQLAKAHGAKVTGVCSSNNVQFVTDLGADQVIAYDKEDIHKHQGKYDLVIDTNGNLKHADFTRMGKRGVLIGFTTMANMLGVVVRNAFSKFKIKVFTASANTEDLTTLAKLIQEGKVKPHIDKMYTYNEIPAAIEYIEAMRTRGKVAMNWQTLKS